MKYSIILFFLLFLPYAYGSDSIFLSYDNVELITIINDLAAKKQFNIEWQQNESRLAQKITFKKEEKVTLQEAWNLMELILNKLGMSIVEQENSHMIISNKTLHQEPLPFYIVSPSALPATEDKIRYLYYFTNVNIASSPTAQANLTALLKDMLPSDVQNSFILDGTTNSLLITGTANIIKGLMQVVQAIDVTGFNESVAVIPLNKANAPAVAAILNQLVPSDANRFGPAGQQQAKFGYYFSENSKIVPIERLNSLIVLGTNEAITRIRDFIMKYLDKDLETGSSILHVKSLEYLDASKTAAMLTSIVTAQFGKAQSVAQQELRDTLSRTIIVAEKESRTKALNPAQSASGDQDQSQTSTPQGALIGGNNLIIAAQHEDWKILEELIDQLDVPQLQVALEVLIVDVSISDEKLIGAQTRNLTDCTLPNNFNWQALHLAGQTTGQGAWLNTIPSGGTVPLGPSSNINMNRGLAADLLEMLTNSNGLFNIATLASAGTTLISFNDGRGIASILELLDQYQSANILSQPFVIAKNHEQANISIAETRLDNGSVQMQSTGGPVVLPQDTLTASLTVSLRPRISKSNIINLEITVQSDNFEAPATTANPDNTILNRAIITNANVGNKEVLVLGGLTKTVTQENLRQTPLISNIPIIGNFFKRKDRAEQKNTLMVFICPTIIQPRLGGGINKYTEDKMCYIKNQEILGDIAMDGVVFENLRDPITRIFFPSTANATNKDIDAYATEGVFGKPLKEQIDEYLHEPIDEPCPENAQKLKALMQDTCNPFKK